MDKMGSKLQQVMMAASAALRRGDGNSILVAQVMTAAPSCVQMDTSTLDLVRLFHAKGFRHLPVTDQRGRLVGIISDRDVLRSLGPGDELNKDHLAGIPAADVMSTDLVTIGPEQPLSSAVRLLLEHGISCLPVLTDSLLVGILTTTDLYVALQALLQAADSSPAAEFDRGLRLQTS